MASPSCPIEPAAGSGNPEPTSAPVPVNLRKRRASMLSSEVLDARVKLHVEQDRAKQLELARKVETRVAEFEGTIIGGKL